MSRRQSHSRHLCLVFDDDHIFLRSPPPSSFRGDIPPTSLAVLFAAAPGHENDGATFHSEAVVDMSAMF
jgi:hypothetical protein